MKLSKIFKMSAVALAAASFSGAALADAAETKGGLKIKTDDGRFEASLGGRMHFDANLFFNDEDGYASKSLSDNSSAYLRRVYLTFKGKFYGYDFKIEPDFAPSSSSGGGNGTQIAFQDVTLSTNLGPGKIIIGQFKPFRSMEDLTSSNDITMIERPFASSSGGFFANPSREFQQGVGYKWAITDGLLWATDFASTRSNNSTVNVTGWGGASRLTFAPVMSDSTVVHTGVSFSIEQPGNNSGGTNLFGAQASAIGGRRGPSLKFGTTDNDLKTFGFELATAMGPFFLQSEAMFQDVSRSGGPTNTVLAYYVQGAYAVTGESRPYKKDDAVFGSIKPINSWGAIELTGRFELAKDTDSATNIAPGSDCTALGKCEARQFTLGMNYYPNPNVRFMLNYVNGAIAAAGKGNDSPSALVFRTQFAI